MMSAHASQPESRICGLNAIAPAMRGIRRHAAGLKGRILLATAAFLLAVGGVAVPAQAAETTTLTARYIITLAGLTIGRAEAEARFTGNGYAFHPQFGQTYPILSRRGAWGAARVQFIDPNTDQVCSLPVEWTNLALVDPFVELAAGRALLRPTDWQSLLSLLSQLATET
jgi:hypothetical protein